MRNCAAVQKTRTNCTQKPFVADHAVSQNLTEPHKVSTVKFKVCSRLSPCLVDWQLLSCHQGMQPAALHLCGSPAQTQDLSAMTQMLSWINQCGKYKVNRVSKWCGSLSIYQYADHTTQHKQTEWFMSDKINVVQGEWETGNVHKLYMKYCLLEQQTQCL